MSILRAHPLTPAVLLLLLSAAPTAAQQEKSMRESIEFPLGSAEIIPSFKQNSGTVINLQKAVSEIRSTPGGMVTEIILHSSSSPEGTLEGNSGLTLRRSENTRTFLRNILPGLPADCFTIHTEAENWDGLQTWMMENPGYAYSRNVLDALGTGMTQADRKRALKSIDGGRAWEDLKKNVFPSLRRTRIEMKYILPEPQDRDTVTVTRTEVIHDTIYVYVNETATKENTGNAKPDPRTLREDYISSAVAGLYTNILYDAATAVNFGTEIPLTGRLSLFGECIFPRWKGWTPWFYDKWTEPTDIQLTLFNAGLRRYFKAWPARDKSIMRGFFLQLNGGVGFYDLQQHDGLDITQGHEFHAGLGIGANIALAPWWRLRLSASYGPAWFNQDIYEGRDIMGRPQWKEKQTTMRWMPTTAEVSLMYILNRKTYTNKKSN